MRRMGEDRVAELEETSGICANRSEADGDSSRASPLADRIPMSASTSNEGTAVPLGPPLEFRAREGELDEDVEAEPGCGECGGGPIVGRYCAEHHVRVEKLLDGEDVRRETNEAKPELAAMAKAAVDACEARKAEDVDAWADRLAADSVVAGEMGFAPRPPEARYAGACPAVWHACMTCSLLYAHAGEHRYEPPNTPEGWALPESEDDNEGCTDNARPSDDALTMATRELRKHAPPTLRWDLDQIEAVARVLEARACSAKATPGPTIELPIVPTTDTEITCMYCRRTTPCEYELMVLRSGETAVMGLHAACLEPLQARNPYFRRTETTLRPELCAYCEKLQAEIDGCSCGAPLEKSETKEDGDA